VKVQSSFNRRVSLIQPKDRTAGVVDCNIQDNLDISHGQYYAYRLDKAVDIAQLLCEQVQLAAAEQMYLRALAGMLAWEETSVVEA